MPETMPWTAFPLAPFGLLVESTTPGAGLGTVPPATMNGWADTHRLIVLRGFAPLPGDDLPHFCETLGPLLDWSFGSVNELKVQADAKNYLFTNRAVPFHWDGAFVGRIPHLIFFACEEAPGEDDGGETLFCDTVRLLSRVSEAQHKIWEGVSITYSTEKLTHYGGSFMSPLLAKHPITGEEVVRYAEPVDDLNPVMLEIDGLPADAQPEFLAEMHARLNDPADCCAHVWRTGDFVVADNHALLHGRNAFVKPDQRHIRRVNIL
jgi:alpha-ketoglutarate-dependent taurine dioxygenase